ncbi:acyl-homoserine-lactone synthase [uncultured Tateyamaria sp.]|uniref:acyl-homoserine-lactone synthase n=1 Tax=uncultured Tateyamaria sp. TaxID=455651 RepID=UPI002624F458|nr:acyl-homoserine-lactone synthase [uncultured Tateyamaria sp.]
MVHFEFGNTLTRKSGLARSMFIDRAEQFHHRLGWDVNVNAVGEERDEYDQLNPLYVVVADEKNRHQASMRLLPTVGRTMVNEHFIQIMNGVKVESPLIWECTRFCISPSAKGSAAIKLLAAGGKIMKELGLRSFVGVFDQKMLPIYRRLGSRPTVIGWSEGRENIIGVGLWDYSSSEYDKMLERSGLSETEMELFFVNSRLQLPISPRKRA